jgi:diguanylate cyclase (GGDEF)-like protein
MPKETEDFEDFGVFNEWDLAQKTPRGVKSWPVRRQDPDPVLPDRCRHAFLFQLSPSDRSRYRAILEELGLQVSAFDSLARGLKSLESRPSALLLVYEEDLADTLAGLQRLPHTPGLYPEILVLRSVEAYLAEPLTDTARGAETVSALRGALGRKRPRPPFWTWVLHPAGLEELRPLVQRILDSRAYRVAHLQQQRIRSLYEQCVEISLLESERPLAQKGLSLALEVSGGVAGAVLRQTSKTLEVECEKGADEAQMRRLVSFLQERLDPETHRWEWIPLQSNLKRGKKRILGAHVAIVPITRKNGIFYLMAIFPGHRGRWDADVVADVDLVVSHMRLGWASVDGPSVWVTHGFRDQWTGLYGEKALCIEGRKTSGRKRRRLPLGLLVIDVDGFKDVNEEQGHLAGGALIRAAARRLHEEVKAPALAGRIGPDVFAVLLRRASHRRLARLAARLKRALGGAPLSLGGRFGAVTVTVTVGYALGEDAAHRDVEMLLSRARTAVRSGKARGGDCIVSYAP